MKADACCLCARAFGLIRHRHCSKQFFPRTLLRVAANGTQRAFNSIARISVVRARADLRCRSPGSEIGPTRTSATPLSFHAVQRTFCGMCNFRPCGVSRGAQMALNRSLVTFEPNRLMNVTRTLATLRP
jgi:hypothetical protein